MNTGAISAPITTKTERHAAPSAGQARGKRRSTSYSTATAMPPRTSETAEPHELIPQPAAEALGGEAVGVLANEAGVHRPGEA